MYWHMLELCNCSKCQANSFTVDVIESYQYKSSVGPTRQLRILLPTVLVIALQYRLDFLFSGTKSTVYNSQLFQLITQ